MKTTTTIFAWALAATLCSQAVSAATRTVANLNNSGPGSLRDTILASASGDTINFSGGGTIVLTNGELAIGRSLTIVGPTAGLTVSGNNSSRVFYISSGTVIISNLVISSGRASGPESPLGGGFYNRGNLSLINCTLLANVAAGGAGSFGDGETAFGGAILNSGELTLLNCTFVSNSVAGGNGDPGGRGGSALGGAVYSAGGMVSVVNCTFDHQKAQGGRGGFASTVGGTGGRGGEAIGGGLNLTQAGATLHNTIFSSCSVVAGIGGNASTPGRNGSATGPNVAGAVTSQGHNLVGETDGSTGWVASDLLGTVAAPLNAHLGPLQNNGGPTFTMALLPISAAIDAGDDAVLASPYTLSTDQRGRARRTGDHVDIGAYEFGGITRLVTTLTDSGGGSLRGALALAMDFDRILFVPAVTGKIRLTMGELLINRSLTIIGPGASVLAISGNTNSRIFHIGPQGNVDIYGLTITEGRVVGTNGIDGVNSWPRPPGPGGFAQGGGVFNEGILRILDSMIVSNSVQGGRGGNGISADFVPWNGADGGPAVGAGIYSAGGLSFLELNRCSLTGNRAVGGDGGSGGDYLFTPAVTAPGMGGYANGAGAFAEPARLENCTVAANLSTGGQGGRGGRMPFVAPFTYGGGGQGGLASGGGLTGELLLTDCSVSANSVTGGMGGTGSVAGAIGETYAGGVSALPLSVQSTIIAGNTGSATSPDVDGEVTSAGWNLIGITDGSSGWTTNDFLGNNSFPLSALLGPCQDNGGPVWTMCPLSGSPARDKGRSDLPTDARGGRRILDFSAIPNAPGGNGSDIGALEVDSLFRILSITKSNSFARVKFKTDAGGTYTLQQTSVVTNRVWTNIVGTVTGNGENLEATDFAPLPSIRFYRVRAD